MNRRSESSHDLRLPSERFYWAVLDTSRLSGTTRSRPRQLGYLFESVLPEPIDSVYAIYRSLGGDRTLACGISVQELAAATTPDTTTLGPASLPHFLTEQVGDAISTADLNLLVGPHEPPGIRRHRRRLTLAVCAAGIVATALLIVGQQRRAGQLDQARALREAAIAAIYDQTIGPPTGSLPQDARLTAELRMLDRTRGPRQEAVGPAEVTPQLAGMLASWPSDLHIQTEQLAVGPTLISLNARLPDEAAAERFEAELLAPPGWRKTQPSIQAERGEIIVRVRMEPEGAS